VVGLAGAPDDDFIRHARRGGRHSVVGGIIEGTSPATHGARRKEVPAMGLSEAAATTGSRREEGETSREEHPRRIATAQEPGWLFLEAGAYLSRCDDDDGCLSDLFDRNLTTQYTLTHSLTLSLSLSHRDANQPRVLGSSRSVLVHQRRHPYIDQVMHAWPILISTPCQEAVDGNDPWPLAGNPPPPFCLVPEAYYYLYMHRSTKMKLTRLRDPVRCNTVPVGRTIITP
jgi:hypothetical protein